MFGAGNNVRINNLTIDGNITSTTSSAIGIMSTSYTTTLTNCCNKAKIVGYTNAAGVYGWGGGTLIKCVNEGEIIAIGANSQSAGISISYVAMNKCYNTGNITNQNGWIAAGICGRNIGANPPIIKNCYNTGHITGNTSGGITAWGSVSLRNCFNSGVVDGLNYVGRIITNCWKLYRKTN